jgi:hypothetical protein
MTDEKKYNIEDFWPGAEELLDQHFQKKRGWTSIMKKIGLGLILAAFIGTFGYFYFNSASGNVESNSMTQLTKDDNSENYIIRSEVANKTNFESKIISATQTNELNSSSNNQNSFNTESNLNLNKKTEKPSKSKANNKIIDLNRSESLENISISEPTVSSKINSITKPGKDNMSVSSIVSVDNNSISKSSSSSVDTYNLNQGGNQQNKNNQLKLRSNKVNPILNINSVRTQIMNTVFSSTLDISTLRSEEIKELESIVLPEENKDQKKFVFLKFGAGLNLVNKNLSSSEYSDYTSRRNQEESAAFFSAYSFHVGLKKQRISVSSGIELNQYGEQIEYSNWLLGDIVKVNPIINYFTDSSANTNYYYIQGNEFNETNFSYFTDSTLSNDTSILKGQITTELSAFKSKTMLSYFELPLIFDYSIFENNIFSVSVNTGISLGFLRATRGYYLSPELNEVFNIEVNNSFRKTMLNGRIGASINWKIANKTSIFIHPNFRFNLQSSFNKNTNINQRYNSIGLQFGIMKGF